MEIDAFILIGGRSRRLGRDKAFVKVGGASLARTAMDTVVESGIARKITFVTGSEAQFGIEATTLDAPFVFDLVPGRGPLGGLHAALGYAGTSWILLLACDYPLVTPELIRLMAERLSERKNAVAPEQADGRPQPLCAFYRVAAATPVVTEIIERPRVPPPMTEILDRLGVDLVKYEEYAHLPGADGFFLNINTEADLEVAVERLGHL
jgi:molybdenum cofactor guanylyltransferase